MAIELPTIWSISAGATRNGAWDFTIDLDDDELLTGTPTITEVTTADLTITNKAVSSAVLEIDKRDVAIGKAVQCTITGFVSGTTYSVRVSVGTDNSQTLIYDQVIVCA